MNNKLSLNTSTIGNPPVPTVIEVSVKSGYDGIEFWVQDLEAFLSHGGTIGELRSRLQDAGLETPSMIALTGWMDAQPEKYHSALDEAKRRMELAVRVGCPRIVASPAMGYVNLAEAADKFGQLYEFGMSIGVEPCLEYLGFVKHINNVPVALEVLKKAGLPNAKLVMDFFHIFRGGMDLSSIDLVAPDNIAIFHMNDAPPNIDREAQKDSDRVLPGDGILPLESAISKLLARGYQGYFSLELFDPNLYASGPWDAANIGFKKCKALLERS